MRAYGQGRPRQIDKVRIRITRKVLNVFGVTECVLSFGRSMTAHAIKPEARIRHRKRRVVVIDALRLPDFRPVPPVLRSFTVLDHDGPTVDSFRRLELVPRCGRRVLFLPDHRATRNQLALVFTHEPFDHRGRVIDLDGRVYTVADAVDEWTGVAKLFVFTPVQVVILAAGEKRFELGLKFGQSRRQKTTWQRQAALLSIRAR